MDSNRIKNVALGARDTLMQEVDAALERVLAPDSPERVANSQAVGTIDRTVRDRGRESVVEQVAYTWFNRLCALRYMDVRGYTPVGLVSPKAGETLPAVLADARRGIYAAGLDIPQRDKEAINAVLSGDTTARDPLGRAYVMLLVAACKTYERSMDYLFGAGQDLGPAIELLAPTDLLSEGSLLQHICAGLDEATCNEGVEVMGWLYQFYVSERKDAFFASKKKATAADIAPATQLFTPNWIVRYLVENSLGRLWMLNFPDSELKDHMDYYVEPEEPETDFLRIYSPEDITFLDPACGSGHILVYAFDLLYLMYEEEGYRPADIPELILKNNLTGIEIDGRAAEIASFCLEMKALEKDAGFLGKDVDANIIVTHKFKPSQDERRLTPWFFADAKLMDTLAHLDEVGSLLNPPEGFGENIQKAIKALEGNGTMEAASLRAKLEDLQLANSAISTSYAITVTNPPYLTIRGLNAWMNKWVTKNYSEEKADLYACFISRSMKYAINRGYAALVTMHSWMFLSSYQELRTRIINKKSIVSLAHFGPHAFEAIGGEVVQTAATIYENAADEANGVYFRLTGFDNADKKREALLQAVSDHNCRWRYVSSVRDFRVIPGFPIAYWASEAMVRGFSEGRPIEDLGDPKQGMIPGNVQEFVRTWHEVSLGKIGFGLEDAREIIETGYKWFPYNKGGGFRRWYGNIGHLINMENNGYEIIHSGKNNNYRLRDPELYFKQALTWSKIGTGSFSMRYMPKGHMFDIAGCCIFGLKQIDYLLAFTNSSVCGKYLSLLSPTLNFEVEHIKRLPVLFDDAHVAETEQLSLDSIALAKVDWDAFESSWDFTKHPLVHRTIETNDGTLQVKSIEAAFKQWHYECRSRFEQLKANEEELNSIFAGIYGMEGEVPIEVPDDKVSVRLADLGRDIRSLVSYGVGCMFGRYSLDEPGLILADEGSTLDDYHAKVPSPTFEPDRTGIIPITDADTEWFEDDIVAQFRRWLAAAYGQDTLDENVAFIEHALGKNLRAYFVRDFYDVHLKTYQKRPIYWLFQSPKKGLSALVYLHRYNPNTVTTLLTEYIRPLREQMEAQARLLEVTGNARDASTATKYRATIDELDKWEHDVIFPLSQKHVALDLDDGVKANYGKPEFKGALRKVKGLN